MEDTISKNLEICTKFINKNFVYLPYKICLISKYGYSNQFEKCLEVILKMSIDDMLGLDDINKLLFHLIFELPGPQFTKRIYFYIPYRINPIEIAENSNESPVLNYSLKSIIDIFSVENIITIFNLMLMEQKLIFVGNEYRLISEITQGFINLMFPIFWINTYVPVVSEEMLKYLQSFMPFIMGVEESLISKAKPFIEEEIIYVVYINKNYIDISNNTKNRKLNVKTILKNIPEIPSEIYDELYSELKLLKKLCEENKNKNNINVYKFDQTLKEIFVKIIVMMVGDYKKYVSYIDNLPLFNTDSFLINRPSKYKTFFTELTQSQIFRQFLHNDNMHPRIYFEKMCNRFSGSINLVKRSSSKTIRKISSVKNCNLLNINSDNTTTVSISPNIYVNKNNVSDTVNDSDSKITLENSQCKLKILIFLNLVKSNIKNNSTIKNYSVDRSIEKDIENLGSSGNYLITPYFINETIIKSDIIKIEEVLIEKFGERLDKTDLSTVNYFNHVNINNSNNSKISNTTINNLNLLQNDFFFKNNIFIINETKTQKKLEFEKINENTLMKRYLIPVEMKNEENTEILYYKSK